MIRRLAILLAMFVVAGAGACRESLDSGAACPALCPAQSVAIRDTLINPVLVFDSTYVGYPERGREQAMLLAARGDTLETRGVIRFDTLTAFYVPTGDTARTITRVDSSRVRLVLDRAKARLPAQVTFDVYDVDDSTAADTSAAAVLALFTADRRIGGTSFLRDSLKDTVAVPLSDSAVLEKIVNKRRLRLGLRASGNGPLSVRVGTVESGSAAEVSYRPNADTSAKPLLVGPISSTPAGADFPEIRSDLTDYTLVAKYAVQQDANTMSVGGIPGRRAYLRFVLPAYIVDSTTVVRATLRLTQRPLAFGDALDTITIHAHVALAGPHVTDLRRATNVISAPGLLVNDSLLVTPADSGVRSIEMFGLLRAWAGQRVLVNPPPQAIVLRASPESVLPAEARFYSTTAGATLRPVMRISYIPRATFGVP